MTLGFVLFSYAISSRFYNLWGEPELLSDISEDTALQVTNEQNTKVNFFLVIY